MDEEIRLSQDLECGICYENVIDKGERFGLLSGCNHSFCLACLRNWRGTADQPKQTVRQCPVCRVETSFIIPSSRMVINSERKKALIDVYRVRARYVYWSVASCNLQDVCMKRKICRLFRAVTSTKEGMTIECAIPPSQSVHV